MKPAFSSSREAFAFAALVAIILALPAVLSGIDWGDRRELYASIPNSYGPYPLTAQTIFDQTNDVDLAVVGSSHLWYALDTPYIQEHLSRQLNQHAEVFTVGWVWAGFDVLYNIVNDLLTHRRVRTLVIYNEHPKFESQNFHRGFRYWHRMGESPDFVDGLPWSARVRLYSISVTGMPRQLLNLLRDNRRPGNISEMVNVNAADQAYWRMDEPAGRLGSARCRGRLNGPGAVADSVRYHPESNATAADVIVDATRQNPAVSYTDDTVPPYQLHFARRLAQLCRKHQTQLVVLHVPTLNEARQETMLERRAVIEALDAPLVGLPGAKLFSGIPNADLPNLFVEPGHLNENGQELFTHLVTPALLALHAKPETH